MTTSPPTPTLGDETDYGPGGQRYNDDLLLAQEERDRAQREFRAVFHVLDHPELRDAFRPKNDLANHAKRKSHVAGFWAVVMALTALACAALEPLWGQLNSPLPQMIVLVSAVLGLISFSISTLVLMYGERKSNWLYARLYTERLRQFHFQTFVWRLQAIADSLPNDGAKTEYRKKREEWFKTFEDEFKGKGNAQLSAILHSTAMPPVWLHPSSDEPVVPGGVDLTEVFRAYETFRFDEQQGYAEYMLRKINRPDPAKKTTPRARRPPWLWYPGVDLPLRAKRALLQNLFISACAILVLLHLGILVSHVGKWHPLEGAWPHVAIVLAALLAIAVKTLSDGFALTREIERYEEYLAVVSTLKYAFQNTSSPRQKVRIMMEMERASFEEMRVFLRSHYEATFLM